MRFSTPSLLGLYGLLLTSAFTLVRGESNTTFMSNTTSMSNTTFMNVREDVVKDYESEGSIPTAKYFSKCSIEIFDLQPRCRI